MGINKPERRTKKMKKRGRELIDNGKSLEVENFSKWDATEMKEEDVPAVEVVKVKALKSKKIRNSKQKDTLSNAESNAVNNGEKCEPAEEDSSNAKKDKLNKVHKNRRECSLVSDRQSTEVSNGEEIEPVIDASKHKKDKSNKVQKNKRKRSLVSDGQSTEVSNGEEIQPVIDGSKHKKDKSNKVRENKRKHSLVSDRQSTEVSHGEETEPVIDDSKHKKDKSKRARKNKTIDTLSSSEKRTVVCDTEEIKPDLKDLSKGKKVNSKKAQIQRKASHPTIAEANLGQEVQQVAKHDVYQISSGEDDDTKGMKKWIKEYHERRPGIKVLQEEIDNFITTYDEQEEQAKREKEASLAEDGWTVVVHRKGGKKTTDSESGVAVGGVAEAAVLEKLANKKSKNVGLDFYRFQRKEAHRSEIMKLQSKFEEDKNRIQQIRAARKFKPY